MTYKVFELEISLRSELLAYKNHEVVVLVPNAELEMQSFLLYKDFCIIQHYHILE